MSSRASILQAVKTNKPALIPLPEINLEFFDETINLVETFIKNVAFVGGRAKVINKVSEIDAEIKALPNASILTTFFFIVFVFFAIILFLLLTKI